MLRLLPGVAGGAAIVAGVWLLVGIACALVALGVLLLALDRRIP